MNTNDMKPIEKEEKRKINSKPSKWKRIGRELIMSVGLPIAFIAFLLIISMTMGLWDFINPELKHFFARDSRLTETRMKMTALDEVPMHFVHVTDIHINDPQKAQEKKKRDMLKNREEDFKRLVKTIQHVIEPKGVFVTGDLTDGQVWSWWNETDKGGLTPLEQKIAPYFAVQSEQQWKTYEQIIREGYHITKENTKTDCPETVKDEIAWFDIRGNHDAFHVSNENAPENYYKHYAIHGGKCTHQQKKLYQITYDEPQKMHFVFIDMSPLPGPPAPYNFFGVLTPEMLQELEEKLATLRKDPEVPIILLAHYPSSYVTYQSFFKPSYAPLQTVMAKYNVTMYLSGHLHDFLGLIPDMTINHHQLSEHESSDFKVNRKYRLIAYDSGKILSMSNHQLVEDEPLFHVTSHPSARIKNPPINLDRFRFFLFFKNETQHDQWMEKDHPNFDVLLNTKLCTLHAMKRVGGGYFFDYELPTNLHHDTIYIKRGDSIIFQHEPFENSTSLPSIWGQIVLLNYWDKAYPILIGFLSIIGFMYLLESSTWIVPRPIKLLFIGYGLGINGFLPLFTGELLSVPHKRLGVGFSWGLIYFPEGQSIQRVFLSMLAQVIHYFNKLYPFDVPHMKMWESYLPLDTHIIYTVDAYHIYIIPAMVCFFFPLIIFIKWIQLYHGPHPTHLSKTRKAFWLIFLFLIFYVNHRKMWGLHVRKYGIYTLLLGPTIAWFPTIIMLYFAFAVGWYF